MSKTVIGWTGAWDGAVPTVKFTSEHKKALVERIRKRRYNFNHADHEFLPYTSPVFEDRTTCVLTKPQWDDVMSEVYKELPRGQRLLPQDIIMRPTKNGILFEKEKFEQEGDNNNG
jgi:hypothetical protein